MRSNNDKMRMSLLALAVQGALIAMCAMPAHADDEEVAALKNPTNTLEVGASNTSKSSAKFGEYNGLNKSGGDLVGNFSVSGGDAYGGSEGTKRWMITGTDLGTTSRALGASVSNQGSWSFGVGYDELTRHFSDTYQTPYMGSVGGNTFVLPAVLAPNAGGSTRVLTPQQLATFNNADVATTRKNGAVSAGVILNAQWDVKFDFNHLEQSGAKLATFGSMANLAAAPTVLGENVAILPNPTNYQTDTINLALNWKGDKSYVSTSYFGSFFHEGYDRVNFQTFAGTASVMEMTSTPPSNQFHQLNVKGGYEYSSTTKLTGGFSYGRNTQNDAFVEDQYSMNPLGSAPPAASLNGLVNTTHADLKLTNQTTKDLVLSAGMKFDERKDKTASNLYSFNALSGTAANAAIFPNTPYSNSKTQLELAGDYRLASDKHLRLAYDRENIRRWCDQYAVSPAATAVTAVGYYPAGTDCVVAVASHDDKLSGTYKLRATEDVNMNFGYSYSKRATTSDPNAITARQGLNGNIVNAAGNGFVAPQIHGINAGDFRGFYPVFDASRKEQMLKAGVNWQANEKLNLGLLGQYTDDKYDSLYGVQNGNSWNLNLDSTYGYSETASFSMYLTQQHRQRKMTDLQNILNVTANATRVAAAPGSTWSDTMKEDDTTIGIGAKQSGMMGSKLELAQDLTYSLGKTAYETQLNYYGLNNAGLPCSAPTVLSCGALPVIRNRMIQFKFTGNYRLDKSSKIAMGYLFQQLKSDDYFYNGLQYGYNPTSLMATNQQSPNYSVNVVTVSYIYNF